MIQAVLSPEPFESRTRLLTIEEGATVCALLAHAVREGALDPALLSRTEVYVDGDRLERAAALDVQLSRGQIVNLVVEPLGGGGGGGDKDIGQILLQVAVLVIASWVGGPAGPLAAMSQMVRIAASAAIMAAGNMAVAALYAPDRDGEAKANDRYALQGASNQYRPWGQMPLVLGRAVIAPDLAVKSYTQTIGEDVWLYGILGVHYGPVAVSDLKIGDTAVSSMGPGEVKVAYHLAPGPRAWSIYPNAVDQTDFAEELNEDGTTPLVRAAGDVGQKFEFDFAFPRGLWFNKTSNGKSLDEDVVVTVRYRPIDSLGNPTGTGAWTAAPFPAAKRYTGANLPAGSLYFRNKIKEPWRVTRELTLPLGRYEFEFVREAPDDGPEGGGVEQIMLTAIRAIRFTPPINDETLSVIEFAVKATALNQGTLAPITLTAEPICDVWDGAAWGDPEPTSNPAALARWLVTGPAAAKPLPSAQADVGLGYWYEICADRGWDAGLVITEPRSQADVLQLLGQRGRAALYWSGRALEASTFVGKLAPRQLFHGRNLRGHGFRIAYPEPLHALRVEFQNIDQDGDPDEVVVYAEGYGPPGPGLDPELEPAVRVETFRIEGQCTIARAWRDGRWEMTERRHRRRVDSWSADIDHIACRLGDRVRLSWWAIRRGLGHARVRCRRWTGGLVRGVRLDQPVEMEVGKTYAIDVRRPGGLTLNLQVQTTPGRVRELLFAAPIAAEEAPAAGDNLAFGESGKISEDVELISIEPQDDYSARLTGVRYIGEQLDAQDQLPLPEDLTTGVTGARRARPPSPRLIAVQASPGGVRVAFDVAPWSGSPITGFTARWRWTPPDPEEGDVQSAAWQRLQALGADARVLVTPPVRALPSEAGDAEAATLVDIELVTVAANGGASEPLLVSGVEVRETPFPPVVEEVDGVTRISPDGSTRGVLFLRAQALEAGAQSELLVQVRERDAGGPTGPWRPVVGTLPAAAPEGDFADVRSGQKYGVRTRWRQADGWMSDWTAEAEAEIPAGSNVASDLTPTSPVREMLDELTATYGDTASAAASAAAAASSAAAAASAQIAAAASQATAATAASDAIAAEAAALIAQGEAQGAAASAAADALAAASGATTAGTAASAAAASATAAAASATNALSSANSAATSATNASSSATTASGHASNAATSASAAANSATSASNSATAAAGSATTASTQATNAGNSATAAAASAVTASSSANAAALRLAAMFPPRPDATASAFGATWLGSAVTLPAVPGSNVENLAGYGFTLVAPTATLAATPTFTTREPVPATPGRTYEVEAIFELVTLADGATATPNIASSSLLADHTQTDASSYSGGPVGAPMTVGEIRTVTRKFSSIASAGIAQWADPSTAVWLRFGARLDRAGGASSWRLRSFTVRDVTERDAAATSATAAATSATAAATSATAAGTSASAAQTSATNAATSAGNASASATQASNSATTAAGHASNAATSAGAAATSATNAGNSATAASGSANTAATHATNAGNSATAAAASSVSASSAYNSAVDAVAQAAPSRPVADLWTTANDGLPENAADITPSSAVAAGALTLTGNTASGGPKTVFPVYPGVKYRVTVEVAVGDLHTHCHVLAWSMLSDGAPTPGSGNNWALRQLTKSGSARATYVAYFWTDAGATVGGRTWIQITDPTNAKLLRFKTGGRSGGSSAQAVVYSVKVEDVTSEIASESSASAAATSALSAATSATSAGTSASAAQTSATNAATSAGSASTSATQASNSATTAAGHASTASTAATNAANSATSAGNSATAASGSASTAATHATNAGNSATAAAASSVSASSSANAAALRLAAMFPPRPDATASAFSTTGFSGSPASMAAVGVAQVENVAGYGYVLIATNASTAAAPTFVTREAVPATAGKVYEVTAVFELVSAAGGATATPAIYSASLLGDYTLTDASPYSGGPIGTALSAGEIRTVTRRFSNAASSGIAQWADPTAAIWVRFAAHCVRAGGDSAWRIRSFGVTDVTALAASEAQAAAAATSASSAATSATAAGTSASAAATSATNAATSAGNASTSATQASNSATTASGHASNAATSATAAANSATSAGNSATAAAGSASSASTSATNAGNSATAAAASAVSAASYAQNASYLDAFAAYRFASSADGFTATNATITTAADGITLTTTATDPMLVRSGLSIQGSRYNRVIVDLERTAARTAGNWDGTLYYTTASHSWNGSYRKQNATDPALGVRQELTFDMAALSAGGSDWLDNTITGIRFDFDQGPGGAFKIRGIRIVGADTAAPAVAASAAATSASSAATSASSAGASATAASGSATTASTAASNASTYASNASTSAGQAATSASTAATQATNAAGSATTAATHASTASAAATSAAASATVAATVGNQALNPNATFADYPNTTYPTGWAVWGTPASVSRTTGLVSPYAMRIASSAGVAAGAFLAPVSGGLTAVQPGQYFVAEVDVSLVAGSLEGAGIILQAWDAANAALENVSLVFSTTKEPGQSSAPGAGVVGRTYRFRALLRVSHASTVKLALYAMAHYTPFGSIAAANTLDFHRVVVRAATQEEIDANTALPPLQASVAAHSSALVILEGDRAEARFALVAAATGGRPARFGLLSTNHSASGIALDADQIFFGDNTYFDDATNTFVTDDGAGKRTVQMGPFGSDALILWQGADTVAPGSATIANSTRAIGSDGRAYVNGKRQQGVYFEEPTPAVPASVTSSWADILTFTVPSGPVSNLDSFTASFNLGIQTTPSNTRSNNGSVAPAGDWELVEQDSSGTTATERDIMVGTWSTSIIGAGPTAANVTDFDVDGSLSRWAHSGLFTFKWGAGGRFVLRMKTNGAANLLVPVVGLRLNVNKYS